MGGRHNAAKARAKPAEHLARQRKAEEEERVLPDVVGETDEGPTSLESIGPLGERIADLLTQSIGFHRKALEARRKGDQAENLRCLEQAYAKRLVAHGLDPECSERAWQDEQPLTNARQNTDTALMAFYRKQLGRSGLG